MLAVWKPDEPGILIFFSTEEDIRYWIALVIFHARGTNALLLAF